jgi:hypothetical protein
MIQSGIVTLADGRTVLGRKGNHLAVARIMRLFVVRLADDEERARTSLAVPTCPRLLGFAEAQFNTEASHHSTVKAECPYEVADTNEDMGKHAASSLTADPTEDIEARVNRPKAALPKSYVGFCCDARVPAMKLDSRKRTARLKTRKSAGLR